MSIVRRNYGKGHSYFVDGEKYDGVTTILSKGLPKPALVYWSAKSVAEYVADNLEQVGAMAGMGRGSIVAALKEVPWTARDKAAAKGTEVHDLAEKLTRGDKVDVPEEIAGYVEACVAFLDEWKVSEVIVERPVANRRWKYAGTVDLVAEVQPPGGIRPAGTAVIDWKTGASGIFPEVCLQLAAYAHAQVYEQDGREIPMPVIDAGYAVWLRPDGYDVYPVEIGEDVLKLFNHIAYVARRADDKNGVLRGWLGEALQRQEVKA